MCIKVCSTYWKNICRHLLLKSHQRPIVKESAVFFSFMLHCSDLDDQSRPTLKQNSVCVFFIKFMWISGIVERFWTSYSVWCIWADISYQNESMNTQSVREPTLSCPCVVSTGRPSLSQVMLGGGKPLEMHSRLMGLWRTTARSAGPVVRMDGGTGEMKRIEIFS